MTSVPRKKTSLKGAVIYCRVSTIEQVENLSLGTQEKHCRDLCQKKELPVLKVFIEKGESAKTANRPALLEMRCKKINVRKEALEEAFSLHLEQIKPKPGFLELFEAVVLDTWKKQQADAIALAASYEGQLEALQEKKEKLVEAFIYDKLIDQPTYQRQLDKIEAEVLAQQIALNESKIDEMKADTVVAFASHLLANARNLWLRASSVQKEKLQKVLFPQGITYLGGNFGTAPTGSIFNTLPAAADEKEKMATRHGFEP